MAIQDGLIKERMRFLGMENDKLRSVRGHALYDTLGQLDLTHAEYFRALGCTVSDYCAQEFGVDLRNISVERFFHTDPDAKWLFPDIVREAVLAGLKRKPVYKDLIARDEHIAGTAYDVPFVTEDAAEEELRTVGEGAAIPESTIKYGERIVRLDKKGRGVVASYEVIRRMSVDMLRVHLARMGERLGRNLDARLAEVLVNGDASGSGTAPVVINTATSGAWTYADLLKAFMKLTTEHYFKPTHLLMDGTTAQKILALDEFQDSALFSFAQSGTLPTPLGMQLVAMADHPADIVTVLDKDYAAQKLTEQDLLVESDKLINQQWDRTYLTVVTDFAILYDKARVVLDGNWS